jgi:hypothetical protein
MDALLSAVTPEGENFVHFQGLTCDYAHRGGRLPCAITNHVIDEHSPIFGAKSSEFKGVISY